MKNLRKDFSKIYDKYINKIYRFVFLKVNSQEIAEDITSEVFLKAWKAFNDREPLSSKFLLSQVSQGKNCKNRNNGVQKQIKNPQAFLYQIARNLVIDYYRRKDKKTTVSIDFQEQEYNKKIEDKQNDLEGIVFLSLEIEQIKNGLSDIRQDYQDIIIWRYLDDLSVKEIAEIFNKSEQAIRVMLYRALKDLREQLKLKNV